MTLPSQLVILRVACIIGAGGIRDHYEAIVNVNWIMGTSSPNRRYIHACESDTS